ALEDLEAASTHISMTERRGEDAERAVDAWLKCVYVEGHIGETFSGTVASVVEFGLFVELDGLFVQGLVHISRLGRDYYHYVPESMALVAERSGARFALADRLEVVIEEVSVATGRIDLALASRVGRRGRRGRRRAG
ncbi:MAG: S1 RNA-binding domain-containing protein, partial [Gammaproteobacteria bacterium]|nr:S1 RNA-binding domain-containing protein [Gammaproteobacteria bacterium]